MFIGEALCLIVFWLNSRWTADSEYQSLGPEDTETATESTDSLTVNELPDLSGKKNLYLFVPTLCDMTATTLMNIGLIYCSASIYQMLRGSVVIFTGILSTLFLKRVHPTYRWFALIAVFAGVSIVGLSGHSGQEEASKGMFGVSMIVLAQMFTATQFVIEEKILASYKCPPLKAVGLEGVFGIASVLFILPIMWARDESGSLKEGLHQILTNANIGLASVCIIFSISTFNFFGLSVTKYVEIFCFASSWLCRFLSSTARSTIDTSRTLFIWIISLALKWESFKIMQVVGFAILIYGTFLFNDVVRWPFPKDEPKPEEEEVIRED